MKPERASGEVPPVLVVDDEPAVAEVTRRHIAARFPELQVLACSDAEVAMELAAASEFSVVLCDLAMPIHNGIEVLAEIRRHHPHTVGMLVSGQTTKEAVIEAVNYAGVWKVVEKPWREEALIGWVREAVELYRSRVAIEAGNTKPRRSAPSPLRVRPPAPVVRLRMSARPGPPPSPPAGVSRPTFAPPIPPPRVGPRYAELQLLDAGGLGAVYRARDTAEDRDVVLKVLAARFAADETAVARLEADVHAAAQLSHRSVVRPHRLDRSPSVVAIAMDYIRGTTVRSVLARCGCLERAAVVEIVDACASALDEAAAHGLMHLQLRADQLMLDRERRLKILGFGQREIARMAVRGGVPRHWFHIAPELAAGVPDDPRMDVYSLAILAHELLCGRAPDHAGEQRPNGPAEYRPTASEDLPAAVREALDRALSPTPGERFDRATTFAKALRSALEV
ncbi:MAG: response regulator [Kiritimatiellae bacterium]|nr:response regulator [Kiritimatiellia bacterium]